MDLNPPMTFGWPDGELALRLGVATLVGLVMGFDREMKGYDAGLRTHSFVALSAAMLTVTSLLLYEQLGGRNSNLDPLRVIQGMAEATGILAAGLIIVRGSSVKNLTTAAYVWLTATLGIASGAGFYPLVAIGTATAVFLLIVIGGMERWLPEKERDHGDN
tara:strand:+ start:46972 stop:47454 length:483 start_codon:yes stop_codon:yes gene_type:complete